MFSKKLAIFIGAIMLFLTIGAFIIGKPPHRDPRLYPIIKKYTPFQIQKSVTGLVIKRKDNKEFKEEPDAISFYKRLQELEKQWAKTHLKIKDSKLFIVDDNGTTVKIVEIKSKKESKFLSKYYGVGR